MAAGQKLYPRATVKKIVKAHSKRNVSKNVDVLVGVPTRHITLCLLIFSADIPRLRSLFTNVRDFAPILRESCSGTQMLGTVADNVVQVDEGSQYQREAGGRTRDQREECQESHCRKSIYKP